MKITASYIVNINTSISRAIKLLQDNEIKILSVTDKKRVLLGTITDGDIRRGLIKGITINDCCSKIMNKRPCFALRNELDKINKLLKVKKILKNTNIAVIEDAAQSFGSQIRGEKSCSFGNISTTSFFPAKPLGCYGDGGAIFTDSDEYNKIIRSLAVHGKGADICSPRPQWGRENNLLLYDYWTDSA